MSEKSNVVEPWPDPLLELFDRSKPIIGTVHVLPTPGAPRYRGQPMREVVELAIADARHFAEGGVDGVVLENEGDIPFRKPADIGPDTVAAITAVAAAVRDAVALPIGINVLANGVQQSLAIARVVEACFVRANQWANAYIANEGFIEGAAAEALRYRHAIDADDIRIFADVHVKHGSHAIVADRSVAEMTHDVEAFDADVLIATGQRTGDPTRVEEVASIKKVAQRPVIVGSGLDVGNAADLLAVADGAIVGSAMKIDGVWWNPVDVERVRAIMTVAERCR